MELVIPDGAQVHITVGHPPVLACPAAQVPQPLPEAIPPPRRRPWLKGALATALLLGAFLVGRHYGAPSEPIGPATAAQAEAAAPPQGDHSAQVPRALAEQLRKPPTVIPPPGQAAPPGSAPDPFGLHE